jgi:hypothetical protein
MDMALATYKRAAFFSKVARDWAGTQGWDGVVDLPHTAPTRWALYVANGDARSVRRLGQSTAAHP